MPDEQRADLNSLDIEASRCRTWLVQWREAVSMQLRRCREEGSLEAMQVDMHFFLIAARNLVRTCERGKAAASRAKRGDIESRIHRALIAFDSVAPDLREMRDLFEHVSEYETGSAQRRIGDVPAPPSILWADDDDGAFVRIAGRHLDVVACAEAADALAAEVLDAFD